jgi:phenylacetate-CoA ligase
MSTVIVYTKNDIKTWSNLVARVLSSGGVTKDDVVQIAYGYNLSTGGFGVHYGAERIGASVIPTSTGNTARQIKIMRDFKSTAFVATPSYALHVAQTLEQHELSPNALSLKYGIFGGEPWSESVRTQIQDRLHITTTDNYGLSEVIGPGVASECGEQCGLHINEDHFLAEIVDPQTLAPVREGDPGELVLTTLTKEAFPVIRFRTRDYTHFIPGPCRCGRKTIRMARVERRTDDVLIIRGVKLFPAQVTAVLKTIEKEVPLHQIVVERQGALDEVTVLLAPSESVAFDEVKQQQTRLETIRHQLSSELGLSMNLKLVERKSLEAAATVVDKRKT